LLYTDNDDFFGGNRLELDPMYALQLHVVHTVRPGLWISGSGAYAAGGESTLEGVASDDRKADVYWGLALGYPITRRIGAKAAYIGKRTQESVGSDIDSFVLALSGMW
jgi:hypothetical protein